MGKPKHSNDPRGEQKGAQQHAEGQHGPKAYAARKDEINDHHRERGQSEDGVRAIHDPRHADGSDADLHERKIENPALERDGRHPLWENRVQHDEADRAADKNRIAIDVARHGHDREAFQVRDGNESHPQYPRDRHVQIKSTGDAGGNRSDADRGNTGHS